MAQMSENIRVIKIFVSSPRDCEAERSILDEAVARINKTQNIIFPVQIDLFKWKESVTPQIGDSAQSVIDKQTPLYDIYLGIMATRFGTPTGKFGSGTEKEFFDALKRYKKQKRPWILFYFNEEAVKPSGLDLEQLKQVLDFKGKASKLGIYREYQVLRGSSLGFFEQAELDLRNVINSVLADEFENSLKIDFPESEGGIDVCNVLTPSSDGKYHADIEYPAKYLRVRVMNLSHIIAKNCLCELIKIESIEKEIFQDLPYFETLRLAWNFEFDNAPPDQRRDISPQGTLFADILFTYKNKESEGIVLRALVPNRHYREILKPNHSYRLTIRASADNRKSQELRLRLDFSKNWENFKVALD